ncbi:MAG: hypothetical protein ACE362_27120 [Phaeodactylibacter xiamenensis]|uniref:Phospholipase n=1 Tax=Phaeodactylibacter xiamenensis TaxID=1524460 RepID=A0A098SBF3_9BACT|nr:hypothetical protein [Phaeodactylibacter xiamenensis]KGE89480.1 hypothetical protein IX84_02550 [Phaeodactylibacter xiamenensis]MCR9055601.1 hypothetical protein [bacterium]
MKPYLVLFLLVATMLPLLAQSSLNYEARYFVNSAGDSLPYRILFPEGYEEGRQNYPLLLFLHGAGERGQDNKAQLTHGARDQVVPVAESREVYEALKQAGAAVKYTEYPEARHNSWDNAFAEPGLFNWLFSQRKTD